MTATASRWAWAEVDLDAIAHNVGVLRRAVAPADVWAVVKADAYGHGVVPVALAALGAGAEGLCVALVQEAAELRAAGVDAPILVLSEQPVEQAEAAVRLGVISTVYSLAQIDALEAAGAAGHRVHLKVDTGMHRVGCAPDQAVDLAREITRRPGLRLDGVFTHLAVADEPADPFSTLQLDRFDAVLAELAAAGIDPGRVHAANSAGGLAHSRARHRLVRTGIALYGIAPGRGVEHLCHELRPALTLRARVSHVKPVAAGARISYGLRHAFATDTIVATVPLGYADGVPRRLFETHGEVLVGAHLEVVMIQGARGEVARELDDELLGGQHRAPDRLLGPLQVTREGVALDRGLARLQQPHDREHRQGENGHREIGHGPVPARKVRPGSGGGLHGGRPGGAGRRIGTAIVVEGGGMRHPV